MSRGQAATTGSGLQEAAPEETACRWELLRALGAVTLGPPASTAPLAASLGLRPWTAAEHTRAFVLALPPYESIYLGPEGKLGGEGADRVAGVWRAVGLTPPGDADHLAAVLALYAELGEASRAAATSRARERLGHLRTAVLWEHLSSWVPVYLDAIRRDPAFAPWADLLDRALRREAALSAPPGKLPLALRCAPRGVGTTAGYGELLDTLIAPVRAGFILTYDDLAVAARQAGLGLRRGERRFALAALMEQDPAVTLARLGRHAENWASQHARQASSWPVGSWPTGSGPGAAARWWSRRAAAAAAAIGQLADQARGG